MNRRVVLSLALLASATFVRAQLVEPEQYPTPHRVVTLDAVESLPKPVRPRIWEVYAGPGFIYDTNINHLLINSTVNSNVRVSDVALYTEAGAILTPDWGKRAVPYFRYEFERYDYQDHPDFSYYKHELYGSVNFWLTRYLAIDQGVEAEWFSDNTGLVVDDQIVHMGLRFKRRKWKGRAGYSLRRDGYVYSPGKDAFSNSGYAELSRRFWRQQSWFLYYARRHNQANDSVFSYHSHAMEAGWVNGWTRRIRVTWQGTYQDKHYDAFDARFGDRRHDRTFSGTVRPSFAFYPTLRLIGAYTYLANDSNVENKDFIDHLYSLRLEARF